MRSFGGKAGYQVEIKLVGGWALLASAIHPSYAEAAASALRALPREAERWGGWEPEMRVVPAADPRRHPGEKE